MMTDIRQKQREADFQIAPPEETSRKLAAGWLMLALFSLLGSGLVVILILLARMPVIHHFVPWVGSFKTALVVHVDLSVLVWFLAFAGLFATLNSSSSRRSIFVGWTALVATVTGAFLIAFSPFSGSGTPFMNNYIPVLENSFFFVGLGLIGAGSALMALRGLFSPHPSSGALRFGIQTALAILLLSLAALGWSYDDLLPGESGEELYYEALFWGGGHLLQFTHTQLMLVTWLWLATICAITPPVTPRVVTLLFLLGAAPTLLALPIYLSYGADTLEHREAFTWLMQYGGGLAALPMGLALLVAPSPASPRNSAERTALWFSMLLFAVGGVIGFMIREVDVTIPAHYHGSIVAITLAYMGLTYHLLPRLGFREPSRRWTAWQPIFYGGGTLLHVFGLAWSGVYDVQRKTAGEAQGLETWPEKLAMSVTGLGGLIAVIGGLSFLVITFMAMRPMRASTDRSADDDNHE